MNEQSLSKTQRDQNIILNREDVNPSQHITKRSPTSNKMSQRISLGLINQKSSKRKTILNNYILMTLGFD
jgi:hypothetical protein